MPPPPPSDDNADAAALREALRLIDEWEVDCIALFDIETASRVESPRKQQPQTTIPSKDTPSKNARRFAPTARSRKDPRKQEIASLHEQVHHLQREFAGEKTRRVHSSNVGEWQGIAAGQQQEKLQSLLANAKLKELLVSQRKYANKIRRLAKRLAHLQDTVAPLMMTPTAPSPAYLMENYMGPAIEQHAQYLHLDQLRQQASGVFASGAFADRQSFCDVRFHHENGGGGQDENGIELHFQVSWLLPFSLNQVADVLWTQGCQLTTKGQRSLLKTEDAHPSVEMKFVGYGAGDARHGHFATLRYPPDPAKNGSVLMVSNMQSRIHQDRNCKVSVDGDGWLLVERVSAQTSSLTRVRWYRRVRVKPANYSAMTTTQRTHWIRNVISGPVQSRAKENLDFHVQAIENDLLSPVGYSSSIRCGRSGGTGGPLRQQCIFAK